jgi:hypothetical protein
LTVSTGRAVPKSTAIQSDAFGDPTVVHRFAGAERSAVVVHREVVPPLGSFDTARRRR